MTCDSPGESVRFVSRNSEAMQALMQLHPLALAKPAPNLSSQSAHDSSTRYHDSPSASADAAVRRGGLKRKAPVTEAAYQDLVHQQVGQGGMCGGEGDADAHARKLGLGEGGRDCSIGLCAHVSPLPSIHTSV